MSLLFAFALVACERVHPAPEESVVLQSAGDWAGEPAVLIVRSGPFSAGVEVRDRGTQAVLYQGVLEDSQLQLGSNAPLMNETTDESVVQVSQDCLATKRLVDGAGALSVRGTRWVRYHAGLLEHGLEGRVSLSVQGSGGERRFEGVTSTRPFRQAAGTEAQGTIRYGSGFFSRSTNARLSIILPAGAGAIDVGDFRQKFSFQSPQEAQGAFHVTPSDREVSVADRLTVQVPLDGVDFGAGKASTGSGTVSYDLKISVTSGAIRLQGRGAVAADLADAAGKPVHFEGGGPIDQTIAW